QVGDGLLVLLHIRFLFVDLDVSVVEVFAVVLFAQRRVRISVELLQLQVVLPLHDIQLFGVICELLASVGEFVPPIKLILGSGFRRGGGRGLFAGRGCSGRRGRSLPNDGNVTFEIAQIIVGIYLSRLLARLLLFASFSGGVYHRVLRSRGRLRGVRENSR